MLIVHVIPLSCYQKKLQNLSHCNCGLQVCQIWIQLTTYGKYCRKSCTKHASLIWSYQRRHWWMAAAMTWSSLANSILRHCFNFTDAYVIHFFLYSPHTVINWIQIWWISGHSWGRINFGVSFCYNSLLAHVQQAFQVSQGSVETLFRRSGKHLMVLQQIYSGNGVPNFIGIAQVLWKILQKHFGLFFSGHTVVMYALIIVYFLSVLWRYETDGTVESTDEILGILSMCDFMCVILFIFKVVWIKCYNTRQLHYLENLKCSNLLHFFA